MKKLSLLLIVAIITALSVSNSVGLASAYSTDGQTQPQREPIKLFNGHNFDGWYTFLQNRGRDNDPKGVFTIRDGMIRISGEEWGCITTYEEFENYRLLVEFKWGELSFCTQTGQGQGQWIAAAFQG